MTDERPDPVVLVDFRSKVKRVGREAFIKRTSRWSGFAMQGQLEQVAKERVNDDGDELPEAKLTVEQPVAGVLILVDATGEFVIDMAGDSADWHEIFAVLMRAAWSVNYPGTIRFGGKLWTYDRGWVRAIREEIDSRRRNREYSEAEKARKLAEKPWICEHCERRFATERGCKRHETGFCYRNPVRLGALYENKDKP